jgi:hypothetical protein
MLNANGAKAYLMPIHARDNFHVCSDYNTPLITQEIYDNIEDTIGSYLEQKGDQQEIALRVKNKYTPNTANGYGDTKWSINNDLIIGSNEGEYDVSDTIGDNIHPLNIIWKISRILSETYMTHVLKS